MHSFKKKHHFKDVSREDPSREDSQLVLSLPNDLVP